MFIQLKCHEMFYRSVIVTYLSDMSPCIYQDLGWKPSWKFTVS